MHQGLSLSRRACLPACRGFSTPACPPHRPPLFPLNCRRLSGHCSLPTLPSLAFCPPPPLPLRAVCALPASCPWCSRHCQPASWHAAFAPAPVLSSPASAQDLPPSQRLCPHCSTNQHYLPALH
jgi:hypothetical protein